MSECLFCKIVDKTIHCIPVYEDNIVLVMMDIFPESNGHCLIIPKTHAKSLFEMPDDTLSYIIKISKKIALAAQKGLAADGIKIVQFNGEAAGQTVFHYHMHVVPAYNGIGFKRHAGEPFPKEKLEDFANKIKAELTL